MPRLPRIHVEGAVYYVSSRGSQNQEIFKDKVDYKMYLDLLTKYKAQHKFKLFTYCLQADSLHLLIEPGEDATISKIMHDLNSLYTKYFNARYDRRGPLFEARFRSVLVEKSENLLKMTRYIHSLGQAAERTSYQFYVGSASFDGLDLTDEVKEVKSFLQNKDNADAYEFYQLHSDKSELDELDKKLKRGSVLGSEAFTEEVKNRISAQASVQKEAAVEAVRVIKKNRVLVYMIGAAVLVATATSLSLYISKTKLEQKYTELLQGKEAEFYEKTRFENISPIALADLNGTVWNIELLAVGKGQEMIKDQIHFKDGKLSSDYFLKQGFAPAYFSLSRRPNGMVVWEASQTNAEGEKVIWRGNWQADVMKGVLSVKPLVHKPEDYSFFSVNWSYKK